MKNKLRKVPYIQTLPQQKDNINFLITFFYFIAFVFTVLNLGGKYIGIPPRVYLSVFSLTVSFVFIKTLRFTLDKKKAMYFIFFLPLVISNCIVSIDIFNTSIYWFFWLIFLISLFKISDNLYIEQFRALVQHLPYIFLSATVPLYFILFPYLSTSLPTKNSLGILASAVVISSLSIAKPNKKIGVLLIGLWILNASDSRSSLFFTLIIIALYHIGHFKIRYIMLYLLLILVGAFYQSELYHYVEEKMLNKEYYATNLNDAISAAQEERFNLLIEGWKLYQERPFLGFGLKTNYFEGRLSIVEDVYTGVHNGYLETLLETGFFIGFVVFIFVLLTLTKTLKLLISGYNNVWLYFLIFGFFRAYGESYLYFNIGNIFSILFLFFSLLIISKPYFFMTKEQ